MDGHIPLTTRAGTRLLLVVVALVGLALLGVVVLLTGLRLVTTVGPGASGLSHGVIGVAALLTGALALWMALGCTVVVVETVAASRGTRVPPVAGRAAPLVPAAARRLVAAALGLGVVVGTVAPASASLPTAGASISAAAPGASTDASPSALPVDPGWAGFGRPLTVDPGWAPARPAAPVVQVAADLGPLSTQARTRPTVEEAVVVRRGDTLWDVAARALPAGASDAQISAEWPRWYEANQDLIGPDPHHITPGQRLLPPGARS